MSIAHGARSNARPGRNRAAFSITRTRSQRVRLWISRLLIATGLLIVGGLLTSFSTTVFLNITLSRPAYTGFIKHAMFAGIGIIAALITIVIINRFRLAQRWLQLIIPIAFIVSLGLALLVQVPGLGMEVNGARRFLDLGFIQFQPSELLKISLVLYLGQLLCWWRMPLEDTADAGGRSDHGLEYDPRTDVELRGAIGSRRTVNPWYTFKRQRDERPVWPELPKRCMVIVLLALGLTVVQPDLGSTGIILGSSFLMFIIAGVRFRELMGFAALLACVIVLGFGMVWLADSDRYDYAAQRLSTWAASISRPAIDEDGPAYQLAQARGALAVGGVWGRGYLNSDQKMNRLPLSTSDFVFPVIVEELGFVGGMAVIALFLFFAWTTIRLAFCCRDPFNKTVISALGFTICMQAFVNIGVTIGTLPLSGLTLPFFSAGGTSIVVSILAVGLMIAFSLNDIAEGKARRDQRAEAELRGTDNRYRLKSYAPEI